MTLDFTNTNSLWASVLTTTLGKLGLKTAIICPGSRSAPLAIAFALHPDIEAIPVLDERSAAFFALGLARQQRQPVVLVCTSGTAGANFFPAIIEARESQVPLIVLTADRPPELRHCNAGQTIDQQKLFGSFPNWYAELAVPALEVPLLAYLRQTLIHAWGQATYPSPGPVHLNQPLREPLAPLPQSEAQTFAAKFPATFFSAVTPVAQSPIQSPIQHPIQGQVNAAILQTWQTCDRGLIIAGLAQPAQPEAYCLEIAHLSQALGLPVLAEGLSPLRNYAQLNPYLISTYDLILRNPQLAAALAPEQVIRLGEMPTSKQLRLWLEQGQPQQWVIEPSDRNLDPLHGPTIHLRSSLSQVVEAIPQRHQPASAYLNQWCQLETQVRQRLDQTMAALPFADDVTQFAQQSNSGLPFEGKVAWLLSQHLPLHTPLMIASSMPVRDVESFWRSGNSGIQPWFNRGANGIDGTLSTALGIAHRQGSSVLLSGDLALLHDTNGFLLRRHLVGHLTIVLINNDGGGIFEMLPVARYAVPFEEFFATPQAIDFAKLCATYAVEHELIQSWEHLTQRLNPLPKQGIRVLEVVSDRKADAQWRQQHLGQLAASLDSQ